METSVRTPTTMDNLFPLPRTGPVHTAFFTEFVVAVLQMPMHALRACFLPLPTLAAWESSGEVISKRRRLRTVFR
jgi:hypothetical protein